MLHSMTAFARAESKTDHGTFTWEIRSVNHRYLEPSFRLPETMRELEPNLRNKLRNKIHRGKLDCVLRIQSNTQLQSQLDIDSQLSQQVVATAQIIKAQLGPDAGMINPLEVLQWPGVIQTPEADAKAIHQAIIDLFLEAVSQLQETRSREGGELKQFITDRAEQITKIVAEVKTQLPSILNQQRQKLTDRLAELKTELDPERLEQEMVILAQKADVDEELDRLTTHVAEVKRVLNQKGAVGRRLDFLMQELNREANTLSSKSIVTDTTQAAVELKVLIEQMREQIQNIE